MGVAWLRGGVGVGVVMVVVLAILPHAQTITIHPAVLKNFVGPYRKPGAPVLRSPFYLPPPDAPMESVPPAAPLRSRQPLPLVAKGAFFPRQEWNRPLRSCTGSASCAQNMDNTLNLLMRMMETGKRR